MSGGHNRASATRRVGSAVSVAAVLLVTSVLAAAVLVPTGAGAGAASRGGALTVYASVTKTAFVNNSDDRARGEGRNPFGNYAGSGVATPTRESLYGPFGGDEGEVALQLYADRAQTKRVGRAIVICLYGFAANGLCDASLELPRGELVGKGTFAFDARTFTFALLGGTGAYEGASGSIAVVARGFATQPKPANRDVPLLQDQTLSIAFTLPSHRGPSLAAYAEPGTETYIDNDDDEERGRTNSAFANGVAKVDPGSGTDGPFPGDEAFFDFAVFSDKAHKVKAGTATYSCQYEFERDAFCDAVYTLKGGTLTGAGAIDFNTKTFAVAIVGGTGKYAGKRGEVDVSPAGSALERLQFRLH